MKLSKQHSARNRIGAILLCVALTGMLAAETLPVVVRAAVSPKEEIWLGQRVRLQIDVLSHEGWAQGQMDAFEIPGTFIMQTESQGVRLNETIEGLNHTGQRYELSVYPQRRGEVVIPAIPIDVEVKRWGAVEENRTYALHTPELVFDVQVPPGAENMRGLISTTQLAVKQEWNPVAEKFMVGDAIKRVISFEAEDISGMSFEPLQFENIEGVSIYEEAPVVNDKYNRGSLTGMRSETLTYVFEKAGVVTLPAFTLVWWDLKSKTLVEVELEGQELLITPNPAFQHAGNVKEVAHLTSGSLWGSLSVAMLILFAVVAWFFRQMLRARFMLWRQQRRESEGRCFNVFRDACRRNDPAECMRSLRAWLDHPDLRKTVGSPEELIRLTKDETLGQQIHILESICYGTTVTQVKTNSFSPRTLYLHMTPVRSMLRQGQRYTSIKKDLLPPLNPIQDKTSAKIFPGNGG